MSDEQPINPCTIPQFTGDLEELEKDRASLTSAAGTFRDAGANVDSEFQGLSAFYSAPEAAQLFATTKPVRTDSDFFADQLDSAAKALGEYVSEARPIVARLKELQAKAATFSNKISGDEHWKDDKDKIDENRDLIHDVNAAVTAFWAAELTCVNKIRALHCAPPLVTDDGTHGPNMYGYKLEDLNNTKSLPWGTQFEETHRAWEVLYWTKSFLWDGIVMDGIVGTVKGLGTFVGFQGLDAAGEAWVGLAKLATGVAITSTPFAGPFWLADEKDLPPWLRDSRKAMKETGKALVAWDEWGKNPARAAGAMTFNVVTLLGTRGAGAAAKAGTAAKVLSAVGKAGRLIDPLTYIGKAGSLTKLKVGDLLNSFNKVDGAIPKIDDVLWKDLPKADAPGVTFPHPNDTVRLPDDALGRPQYYDKTTNQLLDHTGAPKQDLTSVPKGPDHPLAEAPKPQEVPAGVGAHTPSGTTTHTPGGTTTHTPGGTADNLPHNSHTDPSNPTGGGTHTDTPSTGGGGHGDGPGGGGTHTDTPSTGGGHDGPSTDGSGDGPGIPHQGEHVPSAGGEGANVPSRELSVDERAALDEHLGDLEQRYTEDFDVLKHDPDHKGKVAPSEMDEARVALDLRERGKVPTDIQRPPGNNQGDLYSPSTGEFYDIKGVHSDWPPLNNTRDKSMPFKGAYDPANNQGWVRKIEKQMTQNRIVILDVRNANQAAIDDLMAIVERHGWSDRVVWYP